MACIWSLQQELMNYPGWAFPRFSGFLAQPTLPAKALSGIFVSSAGLVWPRGKVGLVGVRGFSTGKTVIILSRRIPTSSS